MYTYVSMGFDDFFQQYFLFLIKGTAAAVPFLCLANERGGNITKKQRMFADEYLIDLNATRAYRAVYKGIKSDDIARKNGSRLLTNADVKGYIDEQLKIIHSEKIATAQEIAEYLTSVMRGEQTEQALKMNGNGIQAIVDISVSSKERIKAAELLGRRYGMFTERVQLEAEQAVHIIDDIRGDVHGNKA